MFTLYHTCRCLLLQNSLILHDITCIKWYIIIYIYNGASTLQKAAELRVCSGCGDFANAKAKGWSSQSNDGQPVNVATGWHRRELAWKQQLHRRGGRWKWGSQQPILKRQRTQIRVGRAEVFTGWKCGDKAGLRLLKRADSSSQSGWNVTEWWSRDGYMIQHVYTHLDFSERWCWCFIFHACENWSMLWNWKTLFPSFPNKKLHRDELIPVRLLFFCPAPLCSFCFIWSYSLMPPQPAAPCTHLQVSVVL